MTRISHGFSLPYPVKVAIFALLAACAVMPQATDATTAALTPGINARGCYDPADYGAIPNDGKDDAPAIQAAIDAAGTTRGTVCLGFGRWNVLRAAPGSYNHFAGISTHGQHVTIAGVGAGTVIALEGDQGGGAIFVISIDPGARDITIRDLTIDTSLATNTEEQTHAIEVGSSVGTGPVEDVRIEHITFEHPSRSTRAGDCLRFVGNLVPNVVRRATVIGSTFTSCARSGIAIQRGVFDLVITGNQFIQASDQDIDSEPTSAGGNGGLTISNNVFHDDTAIAQGDAAVTVGGFAGPMTQVAITGNVFNGRGIGFYRVADVTVSANTFDATMEGGGGVLNIENVATRVAITGNTIRRRGATGSGIRIIHHSGGVASSVTIIGNAVTMDNAGNAIDMESVQNVTVSENDITYSVPATPSVAIRLRSVLRPADGVLIMGNRIDGSLLAGVYLAASPQPFEAVSVVGNMARGPVAGLQCDQSVAGNFHQPIVHAANRWNTMPICAAATLVTSYP